MQVLGFDTSTPFMIAAIGNLERFVEITARSYRRHDELLLVTIEHLLRCMGKTLNDVEYIAVGVGPGSFTGIRVAIATAMGIMEALRIPAITFNTFELLVSHLPDGTGTVAIPARRGYVYVSSYVEGKQRGKPEMITLEELTARLDEGVYGRQKLVGTGWFQAENIPAGILDVTPRGCEIIKLAVGKIENDEKITEPSELVPLYLERPIAEIKSASS